MRYIHARKLYNLSTNRIRKQRFFDRMVTIENLAIPSGVKGTFIIGQARSGGNCN